MDRISIEGLEVSAMVGVLASEQARTQRLVFDVHCDVDFEGAATSGVLSQTMDYATLAEQVKTLAWYGQWQLLESLALGICRLALAPPSLAESRAQVNAVEVVIRKPEILADTTPVIRMRREESWCDLQTRMSGDGVWADVLVQTPWAGAYRVHLDAGALWMVPPGALLHVIGGEGQVDGARPLVAGERIGRMGAGTILATGPVSLLVVSIPPLPE